MKEMTVKEDLQEMLKDPKFKAIYDQEHQKYPIIKKIIEYRIKHKLTQGQLAKRIKVSQQHISKIENGEFSNLTTLEKVLLGIGMSVKISVVELKPKVRKKIAQAMAHAN